MTIRYIADMHFDDGNIIAYDNRPFSGTEEMNAVLTERWNRVVKDDDLTWILGDFCGGDAARWDALLSGLKGRKGLIIGNHDNPAAVEAVRSRFEDVAEYREISDSGQKVILCHYPVFSFRDHYFGTVHLYGHVHTSYEWNMAEHQKRLLKKLYVRDDVCRMANTGAMLPYMDYTPRTLEELAAQL